MKKTKNILLIILLGVLMIVLAGCGKSELTENVEQNNSENKLTIETFRNALKENNLEITNETSKAAGMIGASKGYGLEINGESIEIYEFDENSTDELTVKNIKSAKEEGDVTMPSFNNYTMKAKYNKGLVLTNYEEHPDRDKIISIFNEL